MKSLTVFLALLALSTIAFALSVRSEARIHFAGAPALRTDLSNLLSELDVCSHGTTRNGEQYLVVFCDAGQLEALRASGLRVEVTWKDIRDKFRAMTGLEPGDPTGREFGYYFNYWEMRDTLARLALQYPQIVALDTSMRSYQNRALWCIKISDNPGVAENEPQVFFNGATHAREPMGTHACIAFASLLCQNYGTDSLTTWLVNNREVYIVPVMNPDGYVYNSDSGGSSSYWRKNRNNSGPRTGPGVDLNRNYGYKWGYDDIGSSPSPSSEVYRGPERWSEPEVAAIRDFEAAHKFRCGIDFHSYAQDNLYPWAYIGTSPPELSLIQEIADTFEMNNGYTTGQWYYTLYNSNGVSIDWELSDTLLNGSPKFVGYFLTSELGIYDFWYGWDNPLYVDAEVALNIPNCYYLTRVGGAYLEPLGVVVNDTASGDGDGRLDPGETANLWFRLENRAVHVLDTAASVSASLSSSDTMVQVLTPTANFPSVTPRHGQADDRASQFQVVASPSIAPNTSVNLRLSCTFLDDGVTITQPLAYRITIGSHSGIARSLTPVPLAPLRAFPNPTRGSVRFSAAQGTTIAIYTTGGRLMRTLTSGIWDLTDGSGRHVAPGVYLARPNLPGSVELVKVMVLD
jgi:hypothetical protein